MKIRPNRIQSLLNADWMLFGREWFETDCFALVRASQLTGLYESLIVDSQGKRSEAVNASVGISVTRQVSFKRLGETRHIDKLDADRESGWTIIESAAEAVRWESQLVSCGPQIAIALASDNGPRLLIDTEMLRGIVQGYLNRLASFSNVDKMFAQIRNTSDATVNLLGERLFDSCKFLITNKAAETPYRVACHSIIRFSEEVESGISYAGESPLVNSGLLDRVVLLADQLTPLPKPGGSR